MTKVHGEKYSKPPLFLLRALCVSVVKAFSGKLILKSDFSNPLTTHKEYVP